MTEPGIYTIQLSLRKYNHAIIEGCIGWPEGQKPDSLEQSPKSDDNNRLLNDNDSSNSQSLLMGQDVYLAGIEGQLSTTTIPSGELIWEFGLPNICQWPS